MTSDELEARLAAICFGIIFETIRYDKQGQENCQMVFKALCAVVELHKPHITLVNRTTGATRQKCRCEADYPCPTIQAVTDNLK